MRMIEAAKHALLLAKIENLQRLKKEIKKSSAHQVNKAFMLQEQDGVVQSFNVSPSKPPKKCKQIKSLICPKTGPTNQIARHEAACKKELVCFSCEDFNVRGIEKH